LVHFCNYYGVAFCSISVANQLLLMWSHFCYFTFSIS